MKWISNKRAGTHRFNRGFTRINTDFVGEMMEHVHAGTAGAGYNALPTQLAAGHQTIL